MFNTVEGPPHSGCAGLGRTETKGALPKCVKTPGQSNARPAAIPRTADTGSATVRGTGMSSLISRCRHFARQPWVGVAISAEGVISVKSVIGSSFCTAAPFWFQAQHTQIGVSRKG